MPSDSKTSSSEPLVQFYLGAIPDSSGRFLSDIRAWDHDRLEHTHDYIQWLFPTRQRSQFNAAAPVLDEQQIRSFRESEPLQAELAASFRQMLNFYGLALAEADGKPVVERSAGWNARMQNWLNPGNHNFLRITRILASLRLLAIDPLARAMLAALDAIYAEHSRIIGERTIAFWRAAGR